MRGRGRATSDNELFWAFVGDGDGVECEKGSGNDDGSGFVEWIDLAEVAGRMAVAKTAANARFRPRSPLRNLINSSVGMDKHHHRYSSGEAGGRRSGYG